MKLIKILIGFLFLFNFANGANVYIGDYVETVARAEAEAQAPIKKRITAPEIKIIYPKPTETCEYLYPEVKDTSDELEIEYGLHTRFKDVDLQTGTFHYYIYNGEDIVQSNLLFTNYSCKLKKLTIAEKSEIEKKFKKINFVDEDEIKKQTNSTIAELKKKYLNSNYGDTTAITRLNLSEYILSIITMNNETLDIESSIKHNKVVLQSTYELEDSDLIKEINLDWVSFIFDWVITAHPILEKLKLLLFSMFLPVSLILISFEKISKKAQGLFDQEDIIERSAIGILLFITFVISPNRYLIADETGEKIQYAQSIFQDSIGTFAKLGVHFGDVLSNATSRIYLNDIERKIGISSKKEIKKTLEEQANLVNLFRKYKGIQSVCYSNISDNYMGRNGYQADGITSFPRSENEGKYKISEKIYFKKWGEKSPRLTTTFCRNIDLKVNDLNLKMQKNEEFLTKVAEIAPKEMINNYISIAENMLKNQAQNGFIYAPFVLFNKIFIENLGLFKDESDDSTFGFGIDDIAYSMPWMTVPGSSTVLETYRDLAPKFNAKKSANETVSKIPIIGDSIMNFASYLLDKSSYIIVFAMMKSVYLYLPLVAVTIASILAIGYYFITLFVYSLIAPFYVVYLFSRNQKEQIISFLIRGIVIVFKPVLIVLSLMIASLAIYLITTLGFAMSAQIFGFFTENNIDTSVFTLEKTTLLLAFLHGLVDVSIAIMTSLFAFYFVFNGSKLILSVFGHDDQKGSDIHESVSEIESKATSKGMV